MDKLAIIGANAAITMLISRAKELGYETHVFAWQCGDPGEEAADFFYPIDVADKEAILNKCRELNVCGVCSITSDFAAPVVSYVARNLGLPGNPEKTDLLARNKYYMRKAFKDAGLFCPNFAVASSDDSDVDFSKFTFPVIVKPTDRWSSKGVTRVDRIEDINAAIETAVKESFDNKAIIEEFMFGPEFSAECICQNGNIVVLAVTEKQTTGFPHYIETGHVQPANLTDEEKEKVEDVVTAAVQALGIENGAAHAEFKILDNGEIGIIEIGARMGGDCIGTDLTHLSTGIDYIESVIDVAVGKTLKLESKGNPSPAIVKFILNEDDYNEFQEILTNNPSQIYRYGDIDRDFDREVVDSSTRHGFYVTKGK